MPHTAFTSISDPACWNRFTIPFWPTNWAEGAYAWYRNSRYRWSTKHIRIDTGFRADLVVEDKVIVEIKSVESLAPVHHKQLLTYLRLADKRLGLLINFNLLIKDGVHRVVNGLRKEDHAKSPSRKDDQEQG